ncbi:MAG: hypothetical protein LBI40_03745 [Treponema sp.]|nr:hypothetical protein [Treponema sp.]
MKKIVIGVMVLLSLTNMVFSLEETWLSIGVNFGNYFENESDAENFYAGYLGVNFGGYGFWNKRNIGIFFNYGLLFPVVDSIKNNYKPIIQGDFILGPGFRYNINEKLKLHFGIGLDINLLSLLDRTNIDVKTSDERIALGLGGDIGLKYDITDVIYFNIGTALSYNFASYRERKSTLDNWTNTKRESSNWINGYSMVGIRPYIAIGFNYYQEKGKRGKPE